MEVSSPLFFAALISVFPQGRLHPFQFEDPLAWRSGHSQRGPRVQLGKLFPRGNASFTPGNAFKLDTIKDEIRSMGNDPDLSSFR